MTGFLDSLTRPQPLSGVTVDEPDRVMAAAVTTLLGPEEADEAEVHATARECPQLLRERREAVLALINSSQGTKGDQQAFGERIHSDEGDPPPGNRRLRYPV